jgi:hypothetical protein
MYGRSSCFYATALTARDSVPMGICREWKPEPLEAADGPISTQNPRAVSMSRGIGKSQAPESPPWSGMKRSRIEPIGRGIFRNSRATGERYRQTSGLSMYGSYIETVWPIPDRSQEREHQAQSREFQYRQRPMRPGIRTDYGSA